MQEEENIGQNAGTTLKNTLYNQFPNVCSTENYCITSFQKQLVKQQVLD